MADAAAEGAALGDVRRLAEQMATVQCREIHELNRRRVDIGLPAHASVSGEAHDHAAAG
ncbi:MAG: hypothetical protein ACT4OX_11645 [Actinomycetota bacterium]